MHDTNVLLIKIKKPMKVITCNVVYNSCLCMLSHFPCRRVMCTGFAKTTWINMKNKTSLYRVFVRKPNVCAREERRNGFAFLNLFIDEMFPFHIKFNYAVNITVRSQNNCLKTNTFKF
jgi:hypothetical protein